METRDPLSDEPQLPDPFDLRFPDPSRYELPDHAPEEPGPSWARQRWACPPPPSLELPAVSIVEARTMIGEAIDAYLADPLPVHALLIKAPPGIGKTTVAVARAEALAAAGKRVLYLGPRHDFFSDVVGLGDHHDWWYEWLPRQLGDPETGKVQTCRHAPHIETWLQRGYRATEFCQRICGWDFIKAGCPWHQQKARREPIIYGQHQHLTTGHPLDFHVVIGDEAPFGAFAQEWLIHHQHVVPQWMDDTEPILPLLDRLQDLAQRCTVDGPELLALLGGPAAVWAVVKDYQLPLDAKVWSPAIRRPSEAADVDYFHLPILCELLRREAQQALRTADYPHRIWTSGGYLCLLQRRPVNPKMPHHVIWLDATGDQKLYEAVLGREVRVVAPPIALQGRIYQVHDRANGKSALLDTSGTPRPLAEHLKAQVDRIASRYERVGIITFQGLRPLFEAAGYTRVGHFFAERGTNKFEQIDCLIVAGTPQLDLAHLEKLAKTIYWDRMEPFLVGGKLPWRVERQVYPYVDPVTGTGYDYPVSGIWSDPDLAPILWQTREAEILQAAHRARPNLKPVDVYLLTNIPIAELPLAGLLSIHELLEAPARVRLDRWLPAAALADQHYRAGLPLTAADLVRTVGLKLHIAHQYLTHLVAQQPDRWDEEHRLVPKRRGRPARLLVPRAISRDGEVE